MKMIITLFWIAVDLHRFDNFGEGIYIAVHLCNFVQAISIKKYRIFQLYILVKLEFEEP